MIEQLGMEQALAGLPAWSAHPGDRPAIARRLEFADFNAAFGFMTRVALRWRWTSHQGRTWRRKRARSPVGISCHSRWA